MQGLSAISKILCLEKRLPTTSEMVARATELLPSVSIPTVPQARLTGSLSTKTSPETTKVIGSVLANFGISGPKTILEIDGDVLQRVWALEGGHNSFRELVSKLAQTGGNAVHWTDTVGRVRTLLPLAKRLLHPSVSHTDPGSSSTKINRGVMRNRLTQRGMVLLDGATALAVSRLYAQDHENFARICAASSSVIPSLLDQKKIGHGRIFSEEDIFLVLAHGMIEARGSVKEHDAIVRNLSLAFANYLEFHNPENRQEPYVVPAKWAYRDSSSGIDALANNPEDFANTIERILNKISPRDASVGNILDQNKIVCDFDNEVSGYVLSVVFAGVQQSLAGALARRNDYLRAIQGLLSFAGSTPLDAAKGATAGLDGGMTAGAIAKLGDLIMTEVGAALSSVHLHADLQDMKNYYENLYSSISVSANEGRFVAGQKFLTKNEIEALSEGASHGPVNDKDIFSPQGEPASRRKLLEEEMRRSGKVGSQEEFSAVMVRRLAMGEDLRARMNSMKIQNSAFQ